MLSPLARHGRGQHSAIFKGRIVMIAVQARTLDILIDKAKFDPQTARAVAEAIAAEIQGSELVTVSVLDARLNDVRYGLELKIENLKSELSHRMYSAILGQLAVLLGAAYFFANHLSR
jgi:hypothetical protein